MAENFELAVHEFFMDLRGEKGKKGHRVLHFMGSTATHNVAVFSQVVETNQAGTSGPYFRALLQSTGEDNRTRNVLFIPGAFQWQDRVFTLSDRDVTITLPTNGATDGTKVLLNGEPAEQRIHESAAGNIPTYAVPDTPDELLLLLMRHGDHPDF